MRDLDRAAALSPGDARILVNRALVRQAKGDLACAVADFEAAIRLGGDAPWVPQVRASLAQARAALDQAR
ncbi:MAG: hypothetical protein KIT58_15155 [Planctomycetota bacterium]|nr:hypothetical protein [Planctomycetota bacterium]